LTNDLEKGLKKIFRQTVRSLRADAQNHERLASERRDLATTFEQLEPKFFEMTSQKPLKFVKTWPARKVK
jgi:hypothetical protein